MGVPSFFSWLIRHFKGKIILKQIDGECDHFLIDANCLFHPECMTIKDHFPNIPINSLESKMIERIKNYLTYLYNYTNSKKTNGTFVDGPAPVAKMVQQRKRRFKAIDDTLARNEIKKKHKKPISSGWNNTVITPGTQFMEKLHIELLNFFSKQKSTSTHVYSSYHSNFEGEHKLLQYIKSTVKPDEIVVIYGLDADLIFLAMTSGIENIYLLRESVQLGMKSEKDELYDPIEDVGQELMYVSIKNLKLAFNQQIWHLVESKTHLNIRFDESADFSNDLVVVCFLLGNDFLPHFPSLSIAKGGMDTVIDAYVECLGESTILMTKIVDGKLEINNVFFGLLIEKLGQREENFFREGLPYYKNQLDRRKCQLPDDYSKDIWRLDNLKTVKIHDPIKLGVGDQDVWKFNYYQHHFGASEHQKECIDELVQLYLEGISWTAKYYFEECPDLYWQYPFDHAPFLSDISEYIRKTNFDINTVIFTKKKYVVTPMIQLLAVLPPASCDTLAVSYKKLVMDNSSEIIDMFPKKTCIDYLHKDQYWQCIPKLPMFNIDRIINATKGKKLTKDEKNRNIICDSFIFNPKVK